MFQSPLFDNGQPTQALLEVLRLTDVTHDGTPAGIKKATQDAWRQADKHMGQIKEEYADKKDVLRPHFEQLGLVGEQLPRETVKDYWLVGGSFRIAIQKRYDHALRLWGQGYGFRKKLVLLGGGRPPEPAKETLELLNKLEYVRRRPGAPDLVQVPADEAGIMTATFNMTDVPEEWTKKMVQVNAPRVEGRPKPDPTGEETLRHWLETEKPEPGSCLIFHIQPGVLAFHATASRVLVPHGFTVEVVGYNAVTQSVSQALDSLAKAVYELAP